MTVVVDNEVVLVDTLEVAVTVWRGVTLVVRTQVPEQTQPQETWFPVVAFLFVVGTVVRTDVT